MALKDDLVSVWEMDEASGNAIDAHGSEDLTDIDTCGADTGVISGCRTFNGTSEYFVASDDAALSRDGKDWSMILWVNATSSENYNICSKIGSFPNFEFGVRRKFNGSGNFLCLEIWNNGGGTTDVFATTYGALGSGSWIMVFVSYKASDGAAAISVNAGTQDTSAMTAGIISAGNADFQIGRYKSTGYFAGKVDQCALWDRVISQTEIEEIYNSGNGLAYSEWDAAGGIVGTGVLESTLLSRARLVA